MSAAQHEPIASTVQPLPSSPRETSRVRASPCTDAREETVTTSMTLAIAMLVASLIAGWRMLAHDDLPQVADVLRGAAEATLVVDHRGDSTASASRAH